MKRRDALRFIDLILESAETEEKKLVLYLLSRGIDVEKWRERVKGYLKERKKPARRVR